VKLFRRNNLAKPVDVALPPLPPQPAEPKKSLEIPLSEEQKGLLEKPIDPRVDRILQEIYADQAAAERALKSRRIIDFPHGDSGERQVIQDKLGFWRIVPGAPPSSLKELFHAL
jgi:hypothetical protein